MANTNHLPICSSNKELLKTLIKLDACFVIVGGVAIHHYVSSREVGDLDILIEQTQENVEKIITAITSCQLIKLNFTSQQLLGNKKTQIPVKIHFDVDILTPGNEIDFYHHLKKSQTISIDGLELQIASVDSLILLLSLSKEAKHIADIKLLSSINVNNALKLDATKNVAPVS